MVTKNHSQELMGGFIVQEVNKISHSGTEDKFVKTLFPTNMQGLKILDVGHGYGETGLYIRSRLNLNQWSQIDGLEIDKPYHDLQAKMSIYDGLYLADALDMPIKDKFYDISIAQHVIEHVTKEDGLCFLSEMERVTKSRVIVCTPNGYTESGPLDGNIHNHHLSGWSIEDFEGLGYTAKIIYKNVNSRLLVLFAKLVFGVRGKKWDNEVIVAWKDL